MFKVKEIAKADPGFENLLREVTSKLLQREFYFTVLAQVSIRPYGNKLSHLAWAYMHVHACSTYAGD